MNSPFFHYNTIVDGEALINRHAAHELLVNPEYHTNFLGLKIHPSYLPDAVKHLKGTIEAPPIPANWHADIAEWAAVLRSVEICPGPQFVMGELGCGWGCWMGSSGLAAKAAGYSVRLHGVEADSLHVEWATTSMSVNGFSENEVVIVHGVAAAKEGVALFPLRDPSSIHYGLEPVLNASDAIVASAIRDNSHVVAPMLTLPSVFQDAPRVDLLHVDIQGGEADLIGGASQFLSERVAYLVIGTHSRPIEGQLIDILEAQGWSLEIERPAILNLGPTRVTVDGVQAWRNPRLFA